MNAYELANYIEFHKYNSNYKYVEEAITMLRQQADRIAELEKVSSKPVAYEWDYVASSDGDGFTKITMPFDKWQELIKFVDKPVKQLSDEEIKRLAYQHRYSSDENFARAIIKEITE